MILERLLERLLELTKRLDEVVEEGYDLGDWRDQMMLLHALQLHSQIVIDIALRAAALLGYAPSSGYMAARVLREKGVLGEDDAQLLRSIIGFRNIVVHEYTSLKLEIVDEILREKRYHLGLRLAEKIIDALRSRGVLDP